MNEKILFLRHVFYGYKHEHDKNNLGVWEKRNFTYPTCRINSTNNTVTVTADLDYIVYPPKVTFIQFSLKLGCRDTENKKDGVKSIF